MREKIYHRINEDFDIHLNKISDFLRHPSVSQTGDGMVEIVEYLMEWLGTLGCSKVEAVKPEYYWSLVGGGFGHGALAHTPQEYYVVDGYDGKHARVHGIHEVEKSNVGFLYHFAGR